MPPETIHAVTSMFITQIFSINPIHVDFFERFRIQSLWCYIFIRIDNDGRKVQQNQYLLPHLDCQISSWDAIVLNNRQTNDTLSRSFIENNRKIRKRISLGMLENGDSNRASRIWSASQECLQIIRGRERRFLISSSSSMARDHHRSTMKNSKAFS